MASLVITNGFLVLGGNNVSNYVKSFTFTAETEAVDDTTMGDTNRSNTIGLDTWNLSIEPRADYADNLLDEILWTLRRTSFLVQVRPVNTAIGVGNPQYQSYGMIQSMQLLGGSVGDLAMQPITIVPCKGSNSADLIRATS